MLRQFRGVVPYSQFLQEFRRSVPSASEEDVLNVTDALATSGSILRHGSLVYLRPNEILSTLRRVLPQDVQAVRARLAETEKDLALLEVERIKIERRAGLRSKLLNYTFFTAVLTQWVLLFRLTYWELSWDVIVGLENNQILINNSAFRVLPPRPAHLISSHVCYNLNYFFLLNLCRNQ